MYLNEAQISLTGYVATQPVVRTVRSGATNLSMRVAWTPRRQDRVTGEWTDGNTSYATVICWRRLATNGAVCLRKGDPVVVKGRLSIRPYEDKQGMQKVAVEIEASSVGHDLSRGVAQFQRVRPQTGMTAAEFAAGEGNGAHSLGESTAYGSSQPVGAGLDGGGSGSLGDVATSEFGHGSLGPDPQGHDRAAVRDLADSDAEYPGHNDPGLDDPFFNESAITEQEAAPEQLATPF